MAIYHKCVRKDSLKNVCYSKFKMPIYHKKGKFWRQIYFWVPVSIAETTAPWVLIPSDRLPPQGNMTLMRPSGASCDQISEPNVLCKFIYFFLFILRLLSWNIWQRYIHNQRQRIPCRTMVFKFYYAFQAKWCYDCRRKIKLPANYRRMQGWYAHFLSFLYIYEVFSQCSSGTLLDFCPNKWIFLYMLL